MFRKSVLFLGVVLGFVLVSSQASSDDCYLNYGWLGCGESDSVSLEGCSFTGISYMSAPTENLAKLYCQVDIDNQAAAAVGFYCEDCIHPAPNNCSSQEGWPWWAGESYNYRCTEDSSTGQWTCACSIEGNESSYINFWCIVCEPPSQGF